MVLARLNVVRGVAIRASRSPTATPIRRSPRSMPSTRREAHRVLVPGLRHHDADGPGDVTTGGGDGEIDGGAGLADGDESTDGVGKGVGDRFATGSEAWCRHDAFGRSDGGLGLGADKPDVDPEVPAGHRRSPARATPRCRPAELGEIRSCLLDRLALDGLARRPTSTIGVCRPFAVTGTTTASPWIAAVPN